MLLVLDEYETSSKIEIDEKAGSKILIFWRVSIFVWFVGKLEKYLDIIQNVE